MQHVEVQDQNQSICPRCFEPEPTCYRVTTEELHMTVCFFCAGVAKELDLSVEPLH